MLGLAGLCAAAPCWVYEVSMRCQAPLLTAGTVTSVLCMSVQLTQ